MIRVRVKQQGFAEGARFFDQAGAKYRSAVARALADYGEYSIGWFRGQIMAGAFGPPKRRGSGPPLYKTGNYAGSFRAVISGMNLGILPTGQNRRMPNEVLAAVLEGGQGGSPPRPHWAIFGFWIQRNGARDIGRRVRRELHLGS